MKTLGIKAGAVVLLMAALLVVYTYIDMLEGEASIAEQNRIAAVELYDGEKDRVFALNLKVEDLNRIKNAQIKEMDSIRRVLSVKDKQLRALYGSKSTADIHDTIVIHIRVPIYDDTSYINSNNTNATRGSVIDTCIGDMKWYSICIDNIDSNLVVLTAHFESDLTLTAVEKKEPVSKPGKTWLGRLFQRKVKTLSIIAVEQNPYVKNNSTTFVVTVK